MHHRHVVHRQHVGIRQIDGLAADLNGELRGADDGGADALAGIDQRQRRCAGSARPPARPRAAWRYRRILVLVAENIFGDAAGERQRGRRDRARQRLGQQQRLAEAVERRTENQSAATAARRCAIRRRPDCVGERLRRQFQAELLGHEPRRIVDPRPGALGVGRDQPAADREGRRRRESRRGRSARAWWCRRRCRHAARRRRAPSTARRRPSRARRAGIRACGRRWRRRTCRLLRRTARRSRGRSCA